VRFAHLLARCCNIWVASSASSPRDIKKIKNKKIKLNKIQRQTYWRHFTKTFFINSAGRRLTIWLFSNKFAVKFWPLCVRFRQLKPINAIVANQFLYSCVCARFLAVKHLCNSAKSKRYIWPRDVLYPRLQSVWGEAININQLQLITIKQISRHKSCAIRRWLCH